MKLSSESGHAALSGFRRALAEAERRGCASLWLIDQAGVLVSTVHDAGLGEHVDDARSLTARALKLPAGKQ